MLCIVCNYSQYTNVGKSIKRTLLPNTRTKNQTKEKKKKKTCRKGKKALLLWLLCHFCTRLQNAFNVMPGTIRTVTSSNSNRHVLLSSGSHGDELGCQKRCELNGIAHYTLDDSSIV